MRDRLRKIVSEWGGLDQPLETLDDTADLYAAGLSSLATIQLIMAVEEEFKIEVPDEMLTSSLFQSIESLTLAVKKLRSQRATL